MPAYGGGGGFGRVRGGLANGMGVVGNIGRRHPSISQREAEEMARNPNANVAGHPGGDARSGYPGGDFDGR